jgi:predicted 2-oxoglutarate/Fe(II)-dependent dioxygenase YbiX
MNNIFIKDKIIPNYIIEDFIFDLSNLKGKPSSVYMNEIEIKENIRSSISKQLDVRNYLDYAKLIEKFCEKLNPIHISSRLVLKELEYLSYGISGHFKIHDDAIPKTNPRRFSSITMLSKTDDMQGGDLILYDKNNNKYYANLQIGETILFYSTTLHEVTPITCGGREVLVGWVYDRK